MFIKLNMVVEGNGRCPVLIDSNNILEVKYVTGGFSIVQLKQTNLTRYGYIKTSESVDEIFGMLNPMLKKKEN